MIGGIPVFNVLARITELREARGWSVYHLAKRSGIPQSTIATWYQKNLYPPIDKLEILCQVFEISLPEFFSDGSLFYASPEYKKLLQKWTLLSPKQKEILLSLMDAFISSEP